MVVVRGRRIELDRPAEVADGAVKVPEPLPGDAEVIMGEAVARLQRDGVAVVGNGRSVVPELRQNVTEVRVR